jgi:polysaccharide deacetylase 2 family uncharacterized protein YibQ
MSKSNKKIAIGCRVDRETYDWIQAARTHLQKNSIGVVSAATVIKDILKKAREGKIYGDFQS